MILESLLKEMIERHASDLHLTVGAPPQFRINGKLSPSSHASLTHAETSRLLLGILSAEQKEDFMQERELDFSFGMAGLSRFRVNLYWQRGSIAGCFRVIPFLIPKIGDLGLPEVVMEFAMKPSGLILVTGPTGSGKSTTLAALLDLINEERHAHIVTIEDPIEYVHQHKGCLVNQREVGSDTLSFRPALKHVLRQDPDIVVIGEMRDLETVEAALQISETGHLTFATLHTSCAVKTINRIIDVFPPHQQHQVRTQLSFVLEGIISQLLLPRADGEGRVLVSEVLLTTPAIRHLVRENQIHQLYSQMQMGQVQSRMQTMNQALLQLLKSNTITLESALNHSPEREELERLLGIFK